MATTPSSLSRLAEEWPGWGGLFEGKLAVPEVLRVLDVDRIRVEEYREDGAIIVRAELPGVDPDKDIEVTVTDGALQIRAHREQRSEAEEEGRYRSEFHYGSMMRRIPLPPGVQESDIEATYKDGILEVKIPVPEEEAPATPAKVPITRT